MTFQELADTLYQNFRIEDLNNYIKEIKALPDNEVNQFDKNGYSLLHICAIKGQHSLIQPLLDKKAKIRLNDKFGYNPAHYAAKNGHKITLEYLLNSNNFKEEFGTISNCITGKDKSGKLHSGKNLLQLALEGRPNSTNKKTYAAADYLIAQYPELKTLETQSDKHIALHSAIFARNSYFINLLSKEFPSEYLDSYGYDIFAYAKTTLSKYKKDKYKNENFVWADDDEIIKILKDNIKFSSSDSSKKRKAETTSTEERARKQSHGQFFNSAETSFSSLQILFEDFLILLDIAKEKSWEIEPSELVKKTEKIIKLMSDVFDILEKIKISKKETIKPLKDLELSDATISFQKIINCFTLALQKTKNVTEEKDPVQLNKLNKIIIEIRKEIVLFNKEVDFIREKSYTI